MKSRILFINFSEKEVEKLKHLPLIIERGYLSDVGGSSLAGKILTGEETERDEGIKFYFPHPVYEYNIIFVNLSKNSEIDEEFKDKARPYPKEKRKTFFDFWISIGILGVFLGDYNYSDLSNLGILDLQLEPVDDEDITVNSMDSDNDDSFKRLFEKIKSEVVMPPKKYIKQIDGGFYEKYKSSAKFKYIYWNRNGVDFGGYHNDEREYFPHARPRFILLPQFRNNIEVVEKVLKEIAKIYRKILPEIYTPEWFKSEEYYPEEVKLYSKKIDNLLSETQIEVNELSKESKRAKNKFKSLHGLLCQKGNELKKSVIDVLSSTFRLKIIDADEEGAGSLADEDIIIEINGRKILAEIKGDKSKYPSIAHIGQLWKHLKRSNEIREGALILNYDWETQPKERDLAYTGEYEKELNDIIFIDTKVLFNLAIAIIDFDLPVVEAVEALFQQGRVNFDLEKYIEIKQKTKKPIEK